MAKVWSFRISRVVATLAMALGSLSASGLMHEVRADEALPPMTIAMKYVAVKESPEAAPSPSQEEVQTLVGKMNEIWGKCGIQFVLETYEAPVADGVKILYAPANHTELDELRAAFDDRRHALFVRTGKWNRSGSLGGDGSNGWSTMPPSPTEGVVVEQPVQVNPSLMAHEAGHLIGGLDHVSYAGNLMDHFVSPDALDLSSTQCADARATMEQDHKDWLR